MPEILLKIQAVSYDLRGFFWPHPISPHVELNGVVGLWLDPASMLAKRC
jgi:hypothetical protein